MVISLNLPSFMYLLVLSLIIRLHPVGVCSLIIRRIRNYHTLESQT